MESQDVERRLTTILAADVVGYSRLMGEDEAGTLVALQTHRRELIEPKAAQYHGRTVKLMGDGALMEFPSVVDAVLFAVEVQCAMQERNAGVPEDQRIVYRVGINIGDIMVEGDDIYGEGVNVAARLEGLAEPGGVCVASSVFNQIKGKLDLAFEHLGEKEVKNIAEPVTVYRVVLDAKAAKLVTPVVQRSIGSKGPRWSVVALTIIVVVLAAGGSYWWQRHAKPRVEPTAVERTAFVLPDKPSIAVLPFANMSGNPEQEYFADGMAEDIITDLSKISSLFVIARNSSFAYKNQSPDIRDVGRELGVRYVVEGSVRKSGGRIRINVQLIDASLGHHIWAERYDREDKDIFELQDEVRGMVVASLKVNLTPDEETRLAGRLTASPEAYDVWLRGLRHEGFFTKEDNLESRRLFERAIEIDPGFAAAYASLANAYGLAAENGWSATPEEDFAESIRLAERSVRLDDDLPRAYWALGRSLSRARYFDGERAVAEFERAIVLDPNNADAYAMLSEVLSITGRAEEAIETLDLAMRLNPHFPYWYLYLLGRSQLLLARYDAAANNLEKATKRNPNVPWPRQYLISAYGQLGRKDDAEWEVEELRAQGYETSVYHFREASNVHDPAFMERYLDGLRKAGLPEQ